MKIGKLLYEGKAKQIYETDEHDKIIMHYKDDATAFNAQKKGTIDQKGVFNNKISTKVFEYLRTLAIRDIFMRNYNIVHCS